MKPVITGASNLQVKSMRLIIEFIFVNTPGGWPSDITTTLCFENDYNNVSVVKIGNQFFHIRSAVITSYHSLSIKIVPARVEITPTAPETLVSMTSKINAVKFVNFKVEKINNTITETPATMKERFWDTNQIRRTCRRNPTSESLNQWIKFHQ